MASIFDVAKYILELTGEITAMKLQKLAFYSKAWGLVWDEDEMFPEDFEAWANGAVCPSLYDRHRGLFKVAPSLFAEADTNNIPEHHRETIEKVVEFYGGYTAQQLSDINHQESPWRDARGGCTPTDRCTNVITPASMAEYYSGIWDEPEEEQEG